MTNKPIRAFKWLIFIFVIFLTYIIQTTPYLFEIFGFKPNLLIPLAVVIAMFENELNGAILGALCGILLDISSNTLLGFNAIILMLCCLIIRFLIMYLMRTNFLNFLLFSSITIFIQGCLNFVFFYLIWGYQDVFRIFYKNIIPVMVYTFLISPFLYLFIKKISNIFYDKLNK